jgi:hypothetical protein
MGPLSSPDGAALEIIGNRRELKHSIGGELHGASIKQICEDDDLNGVLDSGGATNTLSNLIAFETPSKKTAAHLTGNGPVSF